MNVTGSFSWHQLKHRGPHRGILKLIRRLAQTWNFTLDWSISDDARATTPASASSATPVKTIISESKWVQLIKSIH